MIKFFGSFRRRFINDGTVRRYLFYAAGEIALVVLGILIALQINNMNELKKTRQKEQSALEEILSDLENNVSELTAILKEEDNMHDRLTSLFSVLDHLQSRKPYNDTLGVHFHKIFNYGQATCKVSAYESLRSIGMDLIEDKNLRSAIGRYYTASVIEFQTAFNELRSDYYNYILDIYRTEFINDVNANGEAVAVPINYRDILSSQTFAQSLDIYKGVLYMHNGVAEATLEATVDLREQIRQRFNMQRIQR